MSRLSKSQKKVVIIMAVAVIAAVVVFAGVTYVNDYYKATDAAKRAMIGNDVVEVVEEDGYYLFTGRETGAGENVEDTTQDAETTGSNVEDTVNNTHVGGVEESSAADNEVSKGIVFYPGGKVEETAYAPLLLQLAESGYEVYLVKMPAKLAVFGMNAAEDIFEKASHIEEWTMMGHSLGGAMAASFSASHDEEVDVLVLLAAYSTEDLTEKEIDVYSIYGSEDTVLNMEKYEEYYSNLPEDKREMVIDGGNHAYYAHYGEQEGDGEATITREEQQECVLDLFLSDRKAS